MLEVDGTFRYEGYNSIEIEEVTAWLWKDRNNAGASTFELNASELDRLHDELIQDPTTWEYDDDHDYPE